MSESPDEVVGNLRGAAREDLWAMTMAVQATPVRARTATFHAQQAVEKLMKAALVASGDVRYPYTHSIGALDERMAAAGLPSLVATADADFLSSFAVGGRYGEDATEGEARRAGELAWKACARLEEIIDEALAKEGPEG